MYRYAFTCESKLRDVNKIRKNLSGARDRVVVRDNSYTPVKQDIHFFIVRAE